jgi:ParB family chromosome partitioning protein
MSKKSTTQMGVDGDKVTDVVLLDANEVFVPDGRLRKIDKAKVKGMVESISKHGQLQPILVDKMGNLLDGNHRLQACIELGKRVEAKVMDIIDERVARLIEIDTNLVRNELSPTEQERHLVERKKIYLELYPETARGGKSKGEAKTFVEDTAEKMGVSKKTVERAIKRGETASEELVEARENKEISTADMDAIIGKTGADKGAQKEALKDVLAKKKEVKEKPKKEELGMKNVLPIDESYYKEQIEELKVDNGKLRNAYSKLEVDLAKAKEQIIKLQERIKDFSSKAKA